MKVETRTHQSRAAHPPDKACGALAGEEVRAPRKRSREGGESDVKKTKTGIYIINSQWVICMPKSQ